MFLGVYAFPGEPASLVAAYERLLQGIPADNLLLHACVKGADGIEVYDACPSRDIFEHFAASAGFREALEAAGLPPPTVTLLGETQAVFAQGRRLS